MPILQKFYVGSTQITTEGLTWNYQDPYPPDSGTTSTWTIPGILIQTFTTSGTYTPGAGVTAVDVVVLGGGGNGSKGKDSQNNTGCGGSGGGVRVYRNVPVSGPVTVTIGGSGTASSFGSLSAPGGMHAAGNSGSLGAPGLSRNLMGLGNGGAGNLSSNPALNPNSLDYGQPGPSVNGTRYGGAGGGVAFNRGFGASANGGAGGGGSGVRYDSGGFIINPTNGTDGYGGGGGGANYSGNGSTPGVGGTGRVMIYEVTP